MSNPSNPHNIDEFKGFFHKLGSPAHCGSCLAETRRAPVHLGKVYSFSALQLQCRSSAQTVPILEACGQVET